MNGKELPVDGPETESLIAYIKFLGEAWACYLEQVHPRQRTTRGEKVHADLCASCHKEDGQATKSSKVGYSIPPLWGDDSFNASAGMAKLACAAAYIRTNMPFGVRYQDPVLSAQQAWDVAAYMIATRGRRPRWEPH